MGSCVRIKDDLQRSLALPLLLLLAGLTAGCGRFLADPADAADPQGGGLAVVVGARANTPAPVLVGAAAAARDQAVTQQSSFSLVVADGVPYQALDYGPLAADGDTVAARADQQESNRRRVDDAVASASARAPESDLLAAMDLAVQTVDVTSGLRALVVVDSGLSTTGALDFRRPGLLDADPVEVADSLADAGTLPDLRGFSVVFQGLGDTVDPQQPLDAAHRTRLAAIWTAVAQRAGAVAVQVDPGQRDAPVDRPLPAVSPVPVGSGIACTPRRILLTGGPLGFRPGEPVLLDRRAATGALRPYAEELIANPRVITEVFGTYADVGDPDLRKLLSRDRAQKIADVLIDLGVPVGQLRVDGLGSDFPQFVPDRDDAGRFDPAAAALNRTVILQPTEALACV